MVTTQDNGKNKFALPDCLIRVPDCRGPDFTIMQMLRTPFVLLCSSTLPVAQAQVPLPFAYNWSRFPAAWFGANATSFESEAQLDEIGRYSLAIFGWQALITATNWTASIYAQLAQASILKARFPSLPVFVYQGFGNANGYDAPTLEIIRTASDGCRGHQPCRKVAEPYTDWFLETDSTPVYSMSACEQMGMGVPLHTRHAQA